MKTRQHPVGGVNDSKKSTAVGSLIVRPTVGLAG